MVDEAILRKAKSPARAGLLLLPPLAPEQPLDTTAGANFPAVFSLEVFRGRLPSEARRTVSDGRRPKTLNISGRIKRAARATAKDRSSGHRAVVDDPYRVAPALSADCRENREGVGTNPKNRL